MAVQPAGDHFQHNQERTRNLPFSRSRAEYLSFLLGRFLRLVYRVGEAGAAEREPRESDCGLAEPVRSIRCGAATAASVHAISNGGALAPVASEAWHKIDCTG